MKAFIAATVCLMISVSGNAQQSKSSRELVMYDPLFWREKLSLKSTQYRQIAEINREFYDGLRKLKQVSYSRQEMQRQLDFGLKERSVKIWATLGPRQKRKLEKILESTSLQGP